MPQEHIFSVLGKAKILLPNWVADAKVPLATALCCFRLSSREFVPGNLYRSDGCMPPPRHWCYVFGTKGEFPVLRLLRLTNKTGYLMIPMPSLRARPGSYSFVSKHPGGY